MMKLRKLFAVLGALCLLMTAAAAFSFTSLAAQSVEVPTSTDTLKDTCGTGISIANADYGVRVSDDSVRWAARFDYCIPVDVDGLHMVLSDIQIPESGELCIGFGNSETGAWVDGDLVLFMIRQKAGRTSVVLKHFKALSATQVQSDTFDEELFGAGKTLDITFSRRNEDEWRLTLNDIKVSFDHAGIFDGYEDLTSVYPVFGVYGSGGEWSFSFRSLTCGKFVTAIEKVEKLIDAIGTVRYDEDSAIRIGEAEAAYKGLAKHLRSGVSNLAKLEAARKQYDKLSESPSTSKPTTAQPTGPAPSAPNDKDGAAYWHNNEFNVHLSVKADADLLAVTDNVAQAAKDACGRLGTVAAVYDVQLKKGSAAAQTTGAMLLRLPVTDGANAVLRWDGTRAVEVPAVIIGNFLCASVDATGVYAVATVTREIPENPNTGDSVVPAGAVFALLGAAVLTAVCLHRKETV